MKTRHFSLSSRTRFELRNYHKHRSELKQKKLNQTMELRLQLNQTIKIKVSDDCTLHTLKQTLLQTLDSSLPPDSVHLSLDRVDEIQELSPENSLQSLGINSHDLVFFTLDPTIEQSKSIDSDLEKLRLQNSEPIGVVPKNCPKSDLLRREMKKHLGGGRNAHKLLVIAVHAVLLDSGLFSIDCIDIPGDWPSTRSIIGMQYAIGEPYPRNKVVLFKFWSLLHSVVAFESIDFDRGSNIYQVPLDVTTFAPNLDSIWANSMLSNKMIDENEWNDIERKMCELWKVVKDGLVLPVFMILPNDVILKIMKLLSGVDIGKLQCVCMELWNVGSENDLWRLKLNQEFPWVADPQNERWKRKFEQCYRFRMDMIAINMEQEPPQPNHGAWQTYIAYPGHYHNVPNPWYSPFAHDPFQHAFGPYYFGQAQNAFDQHLQWQGQGQGQGRGRGQNAFIPHHELQGQGRGQNALIPHHGLQGRGRGQNAFIPHHGLQGHRRGRGRGRG